MGLFKDLVNAVISVPEEREKKEKEQAEEMKAKGYMYHPVYKAWVPPNFDLNIRPPRLFDRDGREIPPDFVVPRSKNF